MKGSKVQLQDAHQNQDSEASVDCILWDWHAKHLITAGADNTILIHSYPSTSSSKLITLRHHKDAVTALAINSNVKSLASGSVDHSVKLYSYPGKIYPSYMIYRIKSEKYEKLIDILLGFCFVIEQFSYS